MRYRAMIRDDLYASGYCRECRDRTDDIDTFGLCPDCYYSMYNEERIDLD